LKDQIALLEIEGLLYLTLLFGKNGLLEQAQEFINLKFPPKFFMVSRLLLLSHMLLM